MGAQSFPFPSFYFDAGSAFFDGDPNHWRKKAMVLIGMECGPHAEVVATFEADCVGLGMSFKELESTDAVAHDHWSMHRDLARWPAY